MARHTDKNGIVTERHGAQVTFTQSRSGKRWHGAFVNPASARDRTYRGYDQPAYMVCEIAYKAYDGAYVPDQGRMYYELTTQGREPGGRRYQYYNTLDEVQAAAIKWAARRFYTDTVVPAEPEPVATSWQDAGYASDPNDAGEHDPYAERNPEAELAELRSEYRYEDDDRYQMSDAQIQYEAELAAEARQNEPEGDELAAAYDAHEAGIQHEQASDCCADGDHERCSAYLEGTNETVRCDCSCHYSSQWPPNVPRRHLHNA